MAWAAPLVIFILFTIANAQIDGEETVREYLNNVKTVLDNFPARNGKFLLPPPFYKDEANYINEGKYTLLFNLFQQL